MRKMEFNAIEGAAKLLTAGDRVRIKEEVVAKKEIESEETEGELIWVRQDLIAIKFANGRMRTLKATEVEKI